MTKFNYITISVDLSDFGLSEGLDYRNKISDRIESKLLVDKNGGWSGCGWFDKTGDIEFERVIDVPKAEVRVAEAFDELGLTNLLIQISVYAIDESEEEENK